MVEFLILFGVLAAGVFVLAAVLKLLVVLLLLPLKLAWWTAKGLLGLLLIVPALVLFVLVLTNALPLILLLLVLPIVAVVAGAAFLLKLVFC